MGSIWKTTTEIINVGYLFSIQILGLPSYGVIFSVSLLGSPHLSHFPDNVLLWPCKQLLSIGHEKSLRILDDIETLFLLL